MLATILSVFLSVFSTYSEHAHHTCVDTIFDCSLEQTMKVADFFAYDLQTDIEHLCSWAFLGTENDADTTASRNAISMVYTGCEYDPIEKVGTLHADVKVPNLRTYYDTRLYTIYKDSVKNGEYHSRLGITYSGSVLDYANASFYVQPQHDGRSRVAFSFDICFGWYLRAFITRRVYRELLEWRLETIIGNLKEYAETGFVTLREKAK